MSKQRSALFIAEFEGGHRTCTAMFDLDPARGVVLAHRAWVSLVYYAEIDEALHQWCNRGRSRESIVDEFMHTRPPPPPIVAARFERDGVVLEAYDRDELLALRSPVPPVMKELPRIVRPRDSRICAYCGGNDGPFECVTYVGAPSGGVPVHVACVGAFFKRLDATPLKLAMTGSERKIIENTLSLFRGRCGHQWVGATNGYFGCPVCGDADGDHHLVSAQEIAVQPEDWGNAWEDLRALADRIWCRRART